MEAKKEGNSPSDLGCHHYKRNCALIAPCCKRQYICRICHDEEEVHELDRRMVSKVVCLKCKLEQDVSATCRFCDTIFGTYYCDICRLYDNTDKKQFHCISCGICRVGGVDNFFHCPRCNICLSIELKDNHKCVDNVSHDKCPVCLDDLHTSRDAIFIPPCGHMLHRNCFETYIKNGRYTCPKCSESMIDMGSTWKAVDEEVQSTEMPSDYQDMKVTILCQDCHKMSETTFHVVGHKCKHCGSYNTTR